MKDPNETVHAYHYDLLGRQTQDRVVAFGDDIDQAVKRIATSYEVRGMVATVTSYDQSGVGVGNVVNQVAYEYDDFGQQTKDSQAHSGAVDGSTPAVSYTHADGSTGNTARRTSTVYPNGRIVETLYGSTGSDNDKLSRVEALKIQGEGQNAASYEYLGLGWYVNVLYPEPSVNLTYLKTTSQPVGDAGDPYTGYDRFGRTVEMLWETTPGEAERDHFVWGYDRASNRTWKANLAASSGQDEHYGYDGLYQVTEADRGNLNFNLTAIGAIPDNTQTFTYDPTGNWDRFTNADDGTETLDQTRVHNQDNQITQIDGSNTGILYDRAGNATQMPPDKDGDWSEFYRLKWDAWNRLVEVKDVSEALVATYAYDGTTRRTTKTVSAITTHFYYNDQWRPVEERENASTDAERQYLWGNRYRDDLVLRDCDTTGNGTLDERLYVTHDYFNPTAILDTSGDVQERYGYSAFGVRRIMAPDFSDRATSSFDWDFGFQGQFLDIETSYYNYGYRYYSHQIGRWLSKDPIAEQGGKNLYGFIKNHVTGWVDELGLLPKLEIKSHPLSTAPSNPNLGDCGEYTWAVQWVVDTPSGAMGGNILQHVKIETQYEKCESTGFQPRNSSVEFWETWGVDPNSKTVNGLDAADGTGPDDPRVIAIDDLDLYKGGYRGCSKGTQTVTAKVRYYPNQALNGWGTRGRYGTHPWGYLIGSFNNPNWPNNDTSVDYDHSLKVEWDCCAGPSEPFPENWKTKLIYARPDTATR